MATPVHLREGAEGLAATLPALLADAQQLAASVLPGAHGRRRAGHGDEFWQYRPATASDSASRIDWRRSARSDVHFVRETEWQAAQSVMLWVDQAQSMRFSGAEKRASKLERARLLALASAVLLVRGGERVGLLNDAADLPPRAGQGQLLRLGAGLFPTDAAQEYGAPALTTLPAHGRALFVSDYLGDLDGITDALTRATDRGVHGAIVQILDPVEEDFPFDGRSIFTSMGGGLRHETLKAGDLRARYLARLAERKDRLAALARLTGWQFTTHHTDTSATVALMWIYHALSGAR
ncbi:DUF58 domain-containing protein [Roseicitreum antarcticum]|uniref:DUF58 domain-containing protein n=1 Tax=Roseicitreum antarcticum TaxID=564137 RepID=UPI000B87EE7A|nr:DUF58 domain-containing protein [Roseicitreum antarcticum]